MHLSEIERRAWENRDTANDHKPALALKAMLDDIESGKIKPVHMIAVYVESDDDGDTVSLYQAGSLSSLAVEGALGRAQRINR